MINVVFYIHSYSLTTSSRTQLCKLILRVKLQYHAFSVLSNLNWFSSGANFEDHCENWRIFNYNNYSFCSYRWKLQISANSDPIRILACRAMANAAVHQWGRSMLIHDVNTTVKCVAAQLNSAKHALQVRFSEFLFEFTRTILFFTTSSTSIC